MFEAILLLTVNDRRYFTTSAASTRNNTGGVISFVSVHERREAQRAGRYSWLGWTRACDSNRRWTSRRVELPRCHRRNCSHKGSSSRDMNAVIVAYSLPVVSILIVVSKRP